MVNKKNYKEDRTLKERGTKKYRERIVEEKEAEKLIKEYKENNEEYIDDEINPNYKI